LTLRDGSRMLSIPVTTEANGENKPRDKGAHLVEELVANRESSE